MTNPIEYANEPSAEKPKQEEPKGNFPPYELNPRIQRMKEKGKRFVNELRMHFKNIYVLIYVYSLQGEAIS